MNSAKKMGLLTLLLFPILLSAGIDSRSSQAVPSKETFPLARLSPPAPVARGDSVQVILRRLSRTQPAMVGYIPETRRWHLITPRRDAVSETLLVQLQDAFYYDIGELCRIYGQKYLADWRALASKSARETFWGTSYLCNRTNNYFGIWQQNKPWLCEVFNFCETILRNDPDPTAFPVFPSFEASLWMFIHTIYSYHFLERLPDSGSRIEAVIQYERTYGTRYWQPNFYDRIYAFQVPGNLYSYEELIFCWSEHEINNLCANCSRDTDRNWIMQVRMVAGRAKD